jgi:hypothetical protein
MDPWDLLAHDVNPKLRWRWLGPLSADLCLWILSQDKPWFDFDSVDCKGRTLLRLVIELWILDTSFRSVDQSDWIRPMKWLIRAGCKLHRRDPKGRTALAYLSYRTLNFEVLVQHWLTILRDCGVNITDYIENERQLYDGMTIVGMNYVRKGKYLTFGRRIVFPDDPRKDLEISMVYVPQIPPEDKDLPLFDAYSSILSLSEYTFSGLFSFSRHDWAYQRERAKENVRESRERDSKQVHITRCERKLLASLATTPTCWSKARQEARLTMEASQHKHELQLSHRAASFTKPPNGWILSKLALWEVRSLHTWAYTLFPILSLCGNVLFFYLWMSRTYQRGEL